MTIPIRTGVPTGPIMGGGSPLAGGISAPGMFPPTLFPPPGSQGFNLQADAALPGVIGSLTTPADLAFQIPGNMVAVISSIELLLDGITVVSDVVWRLLINGSPAPGWGNITILGRNGAASVAKSWDGPLGIEVPLGGLIGVQILNNDGGAYTAGTSLYGWFWPSQK